MCAAERRPESTSSAIFRPLPIRQLRAPPAHASLGARGRQAGADPVTGDTAAERGQAADQLRRRLSRRRRGVDRLREAAEARARRSDALYHAHDVRQRPAQAVQLRDDDHVARAQAVEQAAQLRLVPSAPGGQVFDEPLTSDVLQRLPLRAQGVVVARLDPDVADQHAANSVAAARPGTAPDPRFPPVRDGEPATRGRARRHAGGPLATWGRAAKPVSRQTAWCQSGEADAGHLAAPNEDRKHART